MRGTCYAGKTTYYVGTWYRFGIALTGDGGMADVSCMASTGGRYSRCAEACVCTDDSVFPSTSVNNPLFFKATFFTAYFLDFHYIPYFLD